MNIDIKYTNENLILHGIKCAIYGDSGTGKTRLLATAPKPFIISAEFGLLGLRGQHIPYVDVRSVADVQEVYEWFCQSDEAKQYETIGFDSLSEITELLLADIKPGFKDKRQAYGDMADQISSLIRAFRNIEGFNVVFLAKMQKKEDEDIGKIWYQPLLPGKVLPQGLPYLVDEVFCARIYESGTYGEEDYERIHYLQTYSTEQITCKDRSGALDGREVMDLSVIFDKIRKVVDDD